MGEGVAVGGGLAGSAMQGYQQARAQKTQERMQQVAAMDQHSQTLFNNFTAQQEKDPQLAEVFRQALMKNNSERDALAGEKGPGAWKAVKHIFGFGDEAPGGAGGAKPPVGFADKVDAAATPPPAAPPIQPGSGEETQGGSMPPAAQAQADPNAPPTGYSSPAEAATGKHTVGPGVGRGDIWQRAAGQTPPPAHSEMQAQARADMQTLAGHYTSKQAMQDDPRFWQSFAAIGAGLTKAGLDPNRELGEFLQVRYPNSFVPAPDSDLAKQMALAGVPAGMGVPMEAMMHYVEANGDALKQMQNRHATLAMGVANGTIKKGTPDYQAYSFLQGMLHPDNSASIPEMMKGAYDDKYGASPDTTLKMIKDYTAMQNTASGRDHLSVSVNPDDGFMYVADAETGKAKRMLGPDGAPLFYGAKGALGKLFKSAHEGDKVVTMVDPDILRQQINSGKSADDIRDQIESIIPKQVPDMGPGGKFQVGMKINPRYTQAMAMLDAITKGLPGSSGARGGGTTGGLGAPPAWTPKPPGP